MDRDSARWIIHADLDAFFAAAELLRRPELADRPLAVGGRGEERGVVSSASYTARAIGVRSAMPTSQALRLCPDLVVLPPDFRYYRALSLQFRAILDAFSPFVEVVSVDEAYLDASGSERLFGGAEALARDLKARVRDELGLTVSLGVAPNRLLAKIASDLDKPDGLRVVPHGQEAAVLAPLPIERLPGIGPTTGQRLRALGIETLGALAAAPEVLLAQVAGSEAGRLQTRARGQDSSPVRSESEREPPRSLGHEQTFGRDLRGLDTLEPHLYRLCEETGAALRGRGFAATTVTLKLRYADFATITRQQTLPRPTDAQQDIFPLAKALLARALAERDAPVRLLGVRVTGLHQSAHQLALFDDGQERTRRLNAALDEITRRAGAGVLRSARFAGRQSGARRAPL